jgi:hypothetical protein
MEESEVIWVAFHRNHQKGKAAASCPKISSVCIEKKKMGYGLGIRRYSSRQRRIKCKNKKQNKKKCGKTPVLLILPLPVFVLGGGRRLIIFS